MSLVQECHLSRSGVYSHLNLVMFNVIEQNKIYTCHINSIVGNLLYILLGSDTIIY